MKFWLFLLLLPLSIFSQDTTIVHKILQTNRTDEKIKIDGIADEASWATADVATNFTQTAEGVPGEVATEKTEVKILYSDLGIYIFSSNFYEDISHIIRELGARDNVGNVDWFAFKVDSHQSELGGEIFLVSCMGVQYDAIDQKYNEDQNWDAVWESHTSFDDKGWYAEMFIPYSALRFPSKSIQEWNINFYRTIRNKREVATWNPQDPEVNGEFTQFGVLKGIKDITTPVRLSITPFLATSITNTGFNKDFFSTRSISGGLDLKYGLNDAFTLDMTIIPDFSQAASDSEVLNISPFETRFNENRGFFTEGVDLFEKGNIFYSRRIGQKHFYRDRIYDIEDSATIDYNSKPQIINSTKISGRTDGRLGVGFLNSIESRSFAEVTHADGNEETVLLNPLTNYNVFVLDQNFKSSGFATISNTNVWREGSAYDANVTSGSVELNNKKNTYAIRTGGQFSQKLYEATDNLYGHAAGFKLSKTSGKLQGGVGYWEESDTYNPNDLGFLYNNNERNIYLNGNYNIYKPKKLKRIRFNFWSNYNMLYKPNVFTEASIGANIFLQTKKIFSFGAWGNIGLGPTYDYDEPREVGRFFKESNFWNFGPWISTDFRKPLSLELNANIKGRRGTDRFGYESNIWLQYRVSDRFKLIMSTNLDLQTKDVGYVSLDGEAVGYALLGDSDIVFGTRKRLTISNNLRTTYIFNNKMSLSASGRHYWSKVNYLEFHNLLDDGSLGASPYTGLDESNKKLNDISSSFFNVDLIYKWRFAPGSDLFFIWKNNIYLSDDGAESYTSAFSQTLKEQSINSFTLKALYYLDYNKVMTRLQRKEM